MHEIHCHNTTPHNETGLTHTTKRTNRQKYRIYCDCDKLKNVINTETLLDKPCNKCNKQQEILPIMFPISQLKMTANPHRLAQMKNEGK